jgi:hypothetical protein
VVAAERFSPQHGGWREVDRETGSTKPRSELSAGFGVALPTRLQAKVWRAMTPDDRREVHDRFFPHRQRGCSLEAALSASEDNRAVRLAAVMFGTILAVGIGIFVAFPHAVVWDNWSNADVTVRSLDVLFTSMVIVIPGSMTVPRLLRERASSRRLARIGPVCNPWAGLEDRADEVLPMQAAKSRHNLMWMLGLHRGPPE